MARMSEAEAKRSVDTVRETAAGVSTRFVDQGARQSFDEAAADLVRLVEDWMASGSQPPRGPVPPMPRRPDRPAGARRCRRERTVD